MKEHIKLVRLFIDSYLKDKLILSKNQSHYLLNVMRLSLGSKIRIFNGLEGEFLAEIVGIESKLATLSNMVFLRSQPEVGKVSLGFSPLKTHRTEWLIEKSVELGSKELIPIIFERTIIRKLNYEKIWANIIEATEQSERMDLARLREMANLEETVRKFHNDYQIMVLSENSDISINDLDADTIINKPILIIVGPEGGFTPKEEILLSNYAKKFHLGPRILRAETASIVGLSLIQAKFGDINFLPRS